MLIKNSSTYTKRLHAVMMLIPVLLTVTTFANERPLDCKTRFFSATAEKVSGYATGYGYTRAGALSDAIKNVPKGATRRASKFIKEGEKWKCIIRWMK